MIIDIVLGYAVGKGGLENVIKLVYGELERRGHTVRVFQMVPPENQEWADNISNIYYYGDRDTPYAILDEKIIGKLSLRYEQLTRLLGRPNIVLATHAPIISYLCRLAVDKMELKKSRPIILSWLHGPPEIFGGERCLALCEGHLAISKSIGNQIAKYDNPNKVYYIGNTIDFDHASLIRKTNGRTKFVYVGRIENSQKRLDVLLKGLQNLKGEWALDIIGDGPYVIPLKKMASEFKIDRNINWHGWKEQPWDTITDVSLLILSSDFEGFALILIEALARGVPVISSNWSGADEIVDEDKNGWLFPCGDREKLHNILQDIIDGKKVLPNAETCMDSVEKYRVKNVVDRIEATFHKVVERRS
ncbi:glycosyltransferase [Sporolactobacillus shoreicorticis]|uniref:Glycosyltransferase n=1 Tax=Sporolactobacillus shoreicorticis TaxID=1923877 RepID=A0ABW5RZ23_9BACL|nr:glycosyltransferase [Sporolactobacillus shoreicorticis]MCO7125019.1 glycosyltransferase [Sporolactobacillus shoreicorticis]